MVVDGSVGQGSRRFCYQFVMERKPSWLLEGFPRCICDQAELADLTFGIVLDMRRVFNVVFVVFVHAENAVQVTGC